MDNSIKSQYLKSGITLTAGLEHALTTYRTSWLLCSTFTTFLSFLQAEVNGKQDQKWELQTNVNVNKAGTEQNRTRKAPPSEIVDGKIVQGNLSYQWLEKVSSILAHRRMTSTTLPG